MAWMLRFYRLPFNRSFDTVPRRQIPILAGVCAPVGYGLLCWTAFFSSVAFVVGALHQHRRMSRA